MKAIKKSQATEAVNTIKINLEFLQPNKDLKVIMIISAIKGEGKTIIVSNLANALIANNTKVLIIDADLRHPSLHRIFFLTNKKGLSDLICENVEQINYIQPYNDNIDILQAGHKPANPSELLGSNRMKFILNNLRESYDIILIDTPPLLFFPDALALSKYVDGVILVARYGYTTRDILDHLNKTFELANIKPIGCIFNAVEGMEKKYSDYGYYGYKTGRHQVTKKSKTSKSASLIVNTMKTRSSKYYENADQ